MNLFMYKAESDVCLGPLLNNNDDTMVCVCFKMALYDAKLLCNSFFLLLLLLFITVECKSLYPLMAFEGGKNKNIPLVYNLSTRLHTTVHPLLSGSES